MTLTHIEVADSKNHAAFATGQLLKVVRETPAYYWVKNFHGDEYQVSKKTHRITGTNGSFIRTAKQPLMNL